MTGILYALVTIVAWGTWLAPAQKVPFRNQQTKTFYMASANLLLAGLVAATQNLGGLSLATFWPPFLGGLVWSVSGLCAFIATARLGTARAFGIWAPVNIIVSLLWGALLFDEFIDLTAANQLVLVFALILILAGVVMIIQPGKDGREPGTPGQRSSWPGLLAALGAGVLWGSYFLPIKASQVSLWVANLPFALGIFAGSLGLMAAARRTGQPLLQLPRPADLLRVCATGWLWGVGNYGSLLLIETLGAGKGFTIAQLSVIVNALTGIFWLKEPPPRSRAAVMTLTGCALATLGGILLGNLKGG
jgi:glucose uptake protein